MKYKKIIQTGDYIELFTYDKTPTIIEKRVRKEHHVRLHARSIKDPVLKKKQPSKDVRFKYTRPRRTDNLHRSKKRFYRLVESNISPKSPPLFVSATFTDCNDLKVANSEWTEFIKRANRYFGFNVKYIVVPEFQRRGSVHFHALLFNPELLIYGDEYQNPENNIPKETDKSNRKKTRRVKKNGRERSHRTFSLLWGNGYFDCLATDGNPKLSSYISKYFAKSFLDPRMEEQKLYFTSRNIRRPSSANGTPTVNAIIEQLEVMKCPIVFSDTFSTMWLGNCDYKKFKFK